MANPMINRKAMLKAAAMKSAPINKRKKKPFPKLPPKMDEEVIGA